MSLTPESRNRWKDLPWREIEGKTFKLQKRIYRASRSGKQVVVHQLQKLLISSWYAKCLAVRKVTQDNRGKKSAGVDGQLALSPRRRMKLAESLRLKPRTLAVRRVWIEKRGTTEKRPLGIPTIENRAQQALACLALEPEWEARLEPNSYGFRPGRSGHDAIEAIFINLCFLPKYILDADIAKCFDRIDQQALLGKLSTFAVMRRAIKGWLAAGILDEGKLFPSKEGVQQGGPASPLLANIALHGIERAVTEAFPRFVVRDGKKITDDRPRLIRYADDLVRHDARTEHDARASAAGRRAVSLSS